MRDFSSDPWFGETTTHSAHTMKWAINVRGDHEIGCVMGCTCRGGGVDRCMWQLPFGCHGNYHECYAHHLNEAHYADDQWSANKY